ncbi:hypothetical protein SISSUDRAFT_1047284 [Sistotremastrum suecicum HHB10207 ss-3]|uniref:Uncharacterized protein n=1 Tax=Sistotremastrum suecicum HHB10207 ss-3 TaxID=1314776 RepID=A0A166D7B2_9AGAM|nr:hypothetical protein SISSUDRAFT_1047284 [Sistotremastrum suecicum HHB10207 ss-3]
MHVVWLGFLAQIAAQVYLMLKAFPESIAYVDEPEWKLRVCALQSTPAQSEALWQYWIPPMVFEGLLFVFCIFKFATTVTELVSTPRGFFSKRRRTVSLMEIFLRDMMWYILCAFSFDLVACLLLRFKPQIMAFTNGYLLAGFSIVGTRIILRLHEADECRIRGTLGTITTVVGDFSI